jgi:hypothetical protein
VPYARDVGKAFNCLSPCPLENALCVFVHVCCCLFADVCVVRVFAYVCVLSQMPGGQYTNLLFQSKQLGLTGQWPAIKRAYAAANRVLGDIIKARCEPHTHPLHLPQWRCRSRPLSPHRPSAFLTFCLL